MGERGAWRPSLEDVGRARRYVRCRPPETVNTPRTLAASSVRDRTPSFRKTLAKIRLHRPRAEEQGGRDLLVGAAFGHQLGDPLLGGGGGPSRRAAVR